MTIALGRPTLGSSGITMGSGQIGASVGIVVTPTLSALTLSAATVAENSASGVVVGAIQNRTAGSTLTLTNDAGGRFAISGTNIVTGLVATDYETATSHDITIQESLVGADNTPRSTTLTITVTDVVEFDFYIDPSTGDDANDGSLGSPVATLARLAEIVTNNSTIGIPAGADINEHVPASAFEGLTGLTFQGFGDFAQDGLPVIRSEASISTPWQTSADRADANTNVYSQLLTIQSSRGRPVVAEGDTVLRWVADVATCQSNPGTFHVQSGDLTAGDHMFYVHAVGSTNPNSDGKSYSYTVGDTLRVGDGVTARYLEFGRQAHRDGFRGTGSAVVQNVLFNQTSPVHSALFADGAYQKVGCWQDFDDTRENALGIEFYAVDGRGLTGLFEDLFFVGVLDSIQSQNAIGGHVSGTVNLYDSMTARRCSIRNGRVAFSGLADVLTVDTCRLDKGWVTLGNHTTSLVRDLWATPETGAQQVVYFNNAGDNTVEGLRMYGDTNTAAVRDSGNDLTLSRSVFVRDGQQGFARVLDQASAGNILMQGCVFAENGNGDYLYHARVASLNVASDNNVFEPSLRMHIGGVLYTDLATMQAATSTDANSLMVDPQVADAANGDFSLLAAGLPANCGLERFPTYTTIPETIEAARLQVINW